MLSVIYLFHFYIILNGTITKFTIKKYSSQKWLYTINSFDMMEYVNWKYSKSNLLLNWMQYCLHHHFSSLWVCFVKSKHHIYTCTDWFEGELILRTEYYLCGAHWIFHKAHLELIYFCEFTVPSLAEFILFIYLFIALE